MEGSGRGALSAAHRDLEPGALRHAASGRTQLGTPGRVPSRTPPLRIPGGDGRDVRPAGTDVRRPGARYRVLRRDGRGHDRHGPVHPAPRYPVVGAWCLVLGAWCGTSGAWCGAEAQGCEREQRTKHHSTRHQAPSTSLGPQNDRRHAVAPARREHRRRNGAPGARA